MVSSEYSSRTAEVEMEPGRDAGQRREIPSADRMMKAWRHSLDGSPLNPVVQFQYHPISSRAHERQTFRAPDGELSKT